MAGSHLATARRAGFARFQYIGRLALLRPSQRRSVYLRGDRGGKSPARINYPDGSLQDPLFWLGSDVSNSPNWSAYGAPPWPFNTNAVGGQGEWGGVASGMQGAHLDADGILPAVTRATALVVGPITRTDWRYYRRLSEKSPESAGVDDVELPEPLWISDPQLYGSAIPGGEAGRPTIPRARRLGANSFWATLITHSLWWGTGALLVALDYQQRPLAGTCRILNPDRWNITDDGRYVLLGDGEEDPLESDYDGGWDIGGIRWVMRTLTNYPPCDGVVAGGALSRSGLVLSTGNKMNSYLNSILSSGVPSGMLKVQTPNYTAPQAEMLKEQWMKAHGGSKRSVAVLASGIDFTPLQLSVVDADAVKAKGAWLVDLAHAFNISAALLDASVSSSNNITYASLGDRRRDHLDFSLANLGKSTENTISSLLPWGQTMEIDWMDFIQTDPNQSLPFVESGLDKGYLTVKEVRERLRISPIDNPELEKEPVPPQLVDTEFPPQIESGETQ